MLRDKLARAWIGLEAMRAYAVGRLGGDAAASETATAASAGPSVTKLLWSRWHQGLGELAMEVLGGPRR